MATEFAELLDALAVKLSEDCVHQPMPTVRIDGEFLCQRCWCWVAPDGGRYRDDDDDEEDDD